MVRLQLMGGRPRNQDPSVPVEIALSPKLVQYLDALKDLEGFGANRAEIIRNFVWKEVNRLIEENRLKQL